MPSIQIMAQIFAAVFLLSQLQISFSQRLETRNGDIKCTEGVLEESLLSIRMYLDAQLQELEQKVKKETTQKFQNLQTQMNNLKNCSKGWIKHGTSCYMLSTEKLTWERANDKCRGLSSKLAEIDTMPENVFVANTLKNIEANGRAWLGGSDKTQENTWFWNHTGLPLRFTNWIKGEPNDDKGNEDCMEIFSRNGMWNDMTCSYSSMFVCEKDI